MKEKEKAIRGLLLRDTAVLILFLAAFLGIGGIAFSQALPLAGVRAMITENDEGIV